MTTTQMAAVVESLMLCADSKVRLWFNGQSHPVWATVTRVAQDRTWFNADVESGSAGATWTNGKKITPEAIFNITRRN